MFEDLVALQARLRAPHGCPWDREQTHGTLRTFLLEEAYEVLDALEGKDPDKLASELGDLLLQIVFHAQLAQEAGRFNIEGVIERIHAKLIRRHPHVFGDVKAGTSAEVLKTWEELKAEERRLEARGAAKSSAGASVLDGVPRTLPALLETFQLTRRVSTIGFDWEGIEGLLGKLQEETSELRQALRASAGAGGNGSESGGRPAAKDVEEEVGDLLFVAVNVARFLGADPEIALKRANRKFIERFHWMEQRAARGGRRLAELSRERMEQLWEQSKDRA